MYMYFLSHQTNSKAKLRRLMCMMQHQRSMPDDGTMLLKHVACSMYILMQISTNVDSSGT